MPKCPYGRSLNIFKELIAQPTNSCILWPYSKAIFDRDTKISHSIQSIAWAFKHKKSVHSIPTRPQREEINHPQFRHSCFNLACINPRHIYRSSKIKTPWKGVRQQLLGCPTDKVISSACSHTPKYCRGLCQSCYGKQWKAKNHTPENRAFFTARSACRNPNDSRWNANGARRIKFKFTSIHKWLKEIGPRPSPAYVIIRINDKKHFEKGNVSWGKLAERRQSRDNAKSEVKRLLINMKLSQSEVARVAGISRQRVQQIAAEIGIHGRKKEIERPIELLLELIAEDTQECIYWPKRRVGEYSTFRHNRRSLSVHVSSWEIANKVPVPQGLCVCHTCDNPPCINPKHLFIGTNRDNTRDAMKKGRMSTGESHYNSVLTIGDIHKIRLASKGTLKELAFDLGVSYSTVWRVKNGDTWIHVA